MRRGTVLAVLLGLGLVDPASAQTAKKPNKKPPEKTVSEEEKKARIAFEAGELAFSEKNYEIALVNYQSAYGYLKDPAILFNIAQSFRFLERYAEARKGYQDFLAAAPNSPYRGEIEIILHDVESKLAEQAAKPSSQPTSQALSNPNLYPVEKPPARVGLSLGLLAGGAAVFAGGIPLYGRSILQDEVVTPQERGAFVGLNVAGAVLLVAAPVVFYAFRKPAKEKPGAVVAGGAR
jgi:tetratricopeptide (TPR) repeat protein